MNKKHQHNKTQSFCKKAPIKLWLLIAIVPTFFLSAPAQHVSSNDSLQQLFTTDTTFSTEERLNLAISLIDIFTGSNAEKADSYTLSAIDLARQMNDTAKVVSLWIRYAKSKSGQCNYGDADKAYRTAKATILKTGTVKEKANIHYMLGVNYYNWSKYNKSRHHHEMAIDGYETIRDKKGIARSLSGLSAIASNFGEYELAIGHMQRARDIYIEIDDPKSLARTTLGLGVILESWGKTDRALAYYKQAHAHFKEENNTVQEVNLLLHIGNIFLKQDDFAKAMDYFNRAINLESKANNKRLLSIGYSNMGEAYFAMKEYDTALYFQEKALAIKYEVGDKKRIAISLLNIGEIYFAINNNKLAEENILQCLQLSKETSLKEIEMKSLLMLSKINEKELDHQKANDYLKQYIKLNDEVFDSKSQAMINDLSVKYEAKRIEKENEILKQDDAIKTLELEREKDTTFFTTVFLVFVVIIALTIIFFINSRVKQSRKNYSVLAKKNKEIIDQKENLGILNEELYSSREQYRSIVENATIGMYQTLPNGKIKFANKSLVNMLGYNRLQELQQLNLNKEKNDRQAFIDILEEQQIISGREDIWNRKDGTCMFVNESAWLVKDNNGQTMHYEGIVEDISKRKEAETALKKSEKELQSINNALEEKNKEFERAKNEAIAANEIKSQFLANVSHEIRTPMNSIIGFSELLSNIVTDKKQLSHINAIKLSSKSLLTLINDILDLSKIQAGEVEIVNEPMSFSSVIQNIEQVFRLRFVEKKLHFTANINNNVPQHVFLDRARIRQVLFNLIGNSIKFTNKGSITLEITGKPKSKDTIDLSISIADTGIGISKSDRETIFEAFKQSKFLHEKSYGGTGLGLSISKRLVEAMGGKIELESQPGKGSKFTIMIPNVEKATDANITKASWTQKPPADTKTTETTMLADMPTTVADGILDLDDKIRIELITKFKHKWKVLNDNHVINETVLFAADMLSFAKRKNNPALVGFCETLLFYLNNFDIENIDKMMAALGLIINTGKFDNKNR